MGEGIEGFKRTHNCGDLSLDHQGETVTVMGWVQKRRDHGGLVFLDLRDRSGLVQVVLNPAVDKDSYRKAEKIRSEYVLAVKGRVESRPEENVNHEISTGQLELSGLEVRILSESQTPPFHISDENGVGEELRLKYRYLDLRRPKMQKTIYLRHQALKVTRDYLTEKGFWEIETPIMTKSTPEGARDYLVPSRVNPGKFFALAQSPQIYKQLLMVSGMERYYQIARCFRDEDLRGNRQPEFTQIDLEMSFVTEDDIYLLVDGLARRLFSLSGIELPEGTVPVMSYQEAMERFGSDKPDLRFGMELQEISDLVAGSEFKVFSRAVADGGQVKGINFKGGADSPRSKIDGYTEFVKLYRAKGLAWIACRAEGIKSPIGKFLSDDEIDSIKERLSAETGDLLLFIADNNQVVADALGSLRLKIAREERLIPEDRYEFTWINNFPLLEYNQDEERYTAIHHPFTAPVEEDIPLLESEPEKVRSKAYDLVLNGEELGGGSIRIHSRELQQKVFKALGIGETEAEEKFGFLLEAFEYGTPPHGGIAFGFDRLVAFLSGNEMIRDVIAFPKTQRATSPLTEAPAVVADRQLKELGIRLLD